MAAKKKPSAAQLAARAKFVAMVRAKSKAKKSATKKAATKKASTHKDTKSHNVNIRVVSGTKKKAVAKKKVSGLDKVVRRGTKTNVHYSRISGIGNKIGNTPLAKDMDAVREIELFIENDYQLYKSQTNPILINLTKKYKKGTFDVSKAAKLFRYLIDAGMKRYNKEYGIKNDWHKLLTTSDRQFLAEQMAKHTLIELQSGNEWN